MDGAVLVQTSFSTWDNEYVAAAALRYPSRCRSMGMVDPLDPEAVKHAIYWMDNRGMSGFRFHPGYYNTGDSHHPPARPPACPRQSWDFFTALTHNPTMQAWRATCRAWTAPTSRRSRVRS